MKTIDTRQRKLTTILFVGLALLLFRPVFAAVPSLINFQGKLLDTSKNPRNGTYSMTFSIWDAASGGTQLWTETQSNVAVSNGVFSVQLGASSSISASVFDGSSTYLQVQIGGETASTRQRLVTSPYAYRASVADNVASGSANYIQNSNTLQAGATFYVSSGTVSGPLTVGGVLVTGSSNHQITTAAGLVDATKLTGTISSDRISGTYSNAVTLSSTSNSFSGNGAGLTNVIASSLLPGDTDYIQNRNTLQSGATFYVAKGEIAGPLNVTGTVDLGGTAGVDDVTVNSNLIVSGAGPHIFTGDVRVNGNDLLDSGGTSRITLGSNITLNGNLMGGSGQPGVTFSTAAVFVGTSNGDNFIAFPFTAGNAVTDRNIVVISGANTVDTTTTAGNAAVLGIAVNSAGSGETVYVAISGVVTNVVANAAITAGSGRVCTTTVAGRVASCNTNGAVLGKALTGTTGAGQTLTVVLTHGY